VKKRAPEQYFAVGDLVVEKRRLTFDYSPMKISAITALYQHLLTTTAQPRCPARCYNLHLLRQQEAASAERADSGRDDLSHCPRDLS